MPKRKRVQREHTEDWQTIQHYTLWPEQTAYELLRPVVLFGDPVGKRVQETGTAERTLDRKADMFDEQGMVSLFASKPRKQPQETVRNLPPDMRQLIVDLRIELPTMSLREIAEICEVRFDRRPHTIRSSSCWPLAHHPRSQAVAPRPGITFLSQQSGGSRRSGCIARAGPLHPLPSI
jgi:putative transposase